MHDKKSKVKLSPMDVLETVGFPTAKYQKKEINLLNLKKGKYFLLKAKDEEELKSLKINDKGELVSSGGRTLRKLRSKHTLLKSIQGNLRPDIKLEGLYILDKECVDKSVEKAVLSPEPVICYQQPSGLKQQNYPLGSLSDKLVSKEQTEQREKRKRNK